ncbi:MAG: ArsR/SmtB family transcription factor [Promethearchaeota archaeon]
MSKQRGEEKAGNEPGGSQPTTEVDLEKLLDALGNSTRRIILKKLTRFPEHGLHPDDLQYDLGVSRQGIMKHLQILKDLDLIEPHEVDSEHKGLKKTNYRLKRNLSLSFDISSNYFNIYPICDGCEHDDLDTPEANEYGEFLNRVVEIANDPKATTKDLEDALNDISAELNDVEHKFAEIDRQRRVLIQYKHALLDRARHLAHRIQLGDRQWEILNAVLANWRMANRAMDDFHWLFDEIFDDRLKESRKVTFMRDIEAIFNDLKNRFKFFSAL